MENKSLSNLSNLSNYKTNHYQLTKLSLYYKSLLIIIIIIIIFLKPPIIQSKIKLWRKRS